MHRHTVQLIKIDVTRGRILDDLYKYNTEFKQTAVEFYYPSTMVN